MIRILVENKLNLTIAFDTGDSNFLRICDKMTTDLKKFALFDSLTTGYGASQHSILGLQKPADKYLYKTTFLNIGNGRFNNLVTESNPEAIPAIGSKILDYGTVTLDFINGKFYFDADEKVVNLEEKNWPFMPTFLDDKLIVGVVWQKAAGQLKYGEQIMAIDDTDYSHFELCSYLNSKPVLDGKETAVLTIKDAGGAVRKVTVRKE